MRWTGRGLCCSGSASGLASCCSWSFLAVSLPSPGSGSGRSCLIGRGFGGVVFVLALLFLAAWPLLTIRRPTDAEALKRIDRATGGGHRPATALADELATTADPFARALWAAHRARVLAATGRLKTGIPMPRMANLDRYAIRALAVLLIVPAFFLAGDERMSRLLTAFDWRAPPVPISYRVDAWVTPPGYTGRPPVILPTRRSSDGAERRDAAPDLFKVPAGSIVTLRVTGLANVEIKPNGGIAAAPVAENAGGTPPAAPARPRGNPLDRWRRRHSGCARWRHRSAWLAVRGHCRPGADHCLRARPTDRPAQPAGLCLQA